ncbi:MAG: CDP-alcohol phosphatidyltransferase family protein [Candidatus Aenigmatarchaeota archaeon]|nr:CDP-alcohol phosphatidyltransferase family protein [Candidatus Aenigmarchaeota archaeon]
MYKISRHITVADWISLTAALLGFAALLLIVLGYAALAALAMVIAAIADYLDGRIARRLGGSHDWGKQVDSLCDVVAFAVAPAFLAWSIIASGAASYSLGLAVTLGFMFPAMVIVAGILRLARYNISTIRGLYVGMPITMNGIIFPVVWLATFGLSIEISAVIMAATCVASSVLMVSNFIIRKR